MSQMTLATLVSVLLCPRPAGCAPNLIRDGSSFETGYDGFSSFLGYTWTRHGLAGTDPRQGVIDSSTAAHGKHSLKMFFSPPYGREGFSPWCTFRWIKVEQGQTYTISLYAKGSHDGQPLTVSVADTWQDWGWSRFELTSEWRRYSNQITMGKTEGSYAWVLIPYPEDGAAWIDAVQLEEGDLSDYAPRRPVDLGLSCSHPTKYENLFLKGDEVRLDATVFSDKGRRSLGLRYHVEDFFGGIPYNGTVSLRTPPTGRASTELPLGSVDPGSYRAAVEVRGEEGEVLDHEELVFGVIEKGRRKSDVDSRFGLHGFPHPVLQHCGVGWLRTYLLAWSAVEPQEGRFSWPEERGEDRLFLRNLENYGINALPVLAAIPEWARSDEPAHGGWSEGQSEGARLPRLDAWRKYVFETVSRYRDRFRYWEIMNEPTAWMNAEDYLPVLKTAYEAAKQADPECKIVAGDTAWADNEFLEDLAARGGLDYIDVFCGHFYGVADAGPPEVKYAGKGADSVVDYLRDVFRDNGSPNLPIWNTEEGVYVPSWYSKEIMPKSREPWHRVPNVHRQARDMVRSHVIELASGIEKVFWFYELYSERCADARWIIRPEGMYAIEYDGAPRPALVAHSVMARKLDGPEPLGKEVDLGEKTHCYVFSDDERAVAVAWYWGEEDGDVSISMDSDPRLEVANMMGNAIDAAAGDRLRFTLSENPLYIEAEGLSGEELFVRLSEAAAKR